MSAQDNVTAGLVLRRIGTALGAIVLVLVLVVAVAFLRTCVFADPPGAGAKAAECYRSANGVMRAVYRFKQAHGSFPDSIKDLPQLGLAPFLSTPDGYPIEYRSDGTKFEIGFQYTGPGMNYCHYSSLTRRWSCGGYF